MNLEIGDTLAILRNLSDFGTFARKNPELAAKMCSQIVDRTDMFTSHNRVRSGPYAEGRALRLLERNAEIVRLFTEEEMSVAQLAEKFDLVPVTIRNILADLEVHSYNQNGTHRANCRVCAAGGAAAAA